MPEETDVTPEPSPAPADDVKEAPSPPPEGEKSDPPTDKDAVDSSTDKAEETPDLKKEIEAAFAEEKGELPKKEEPEKEPDSKEEVKEKEPEKDPEPEDLTAVPEDIKEGSKSYERFQKLANDNKEKVTQIETLTTHVESMQGMVRDAGLDKDSFKEMIDYAQVRNTGDPREALKFVEAERKALLLKIGEPIEAPSVLEDFPDLQKRVADFDLSEADALKLAQAETNEKLTKQSEEKAKSEADTQGNFEEAVKKNSDIVTAMEQDWQKNDVDYTAKRQILLEQLPAIQKQPPETWPELVKNAYEMITRATQSAKRPTLDPESPMPKSDTGEGGKQEPSTLKEAIDLALGANP